MPMPPPPEYFCTNCKNIFQVSQREAAQQPRGGAAGRAAGAGRRQGGTDPQQEARARPGQARVRPRQVSAETVAEDCQTRARGDRSGRGRRGQQQGRGSDRRDQEEKSEH